MKIWKSLAKIRQADVGLNKVNRHYREEREKVFFLAYKDAGDLITKLDSG